MPKGVSADIRPRRCLIWVCGRLKWRRKLWRKKKFRAIYSSDLLRAVQTAQPLSKLLDLPIISTPAFRERKVGVLEGLTFEESKAAHPKDYYALVNRNIQHVITGGESYRQLLRRATKELHEVLRNHHGENVVIFSHTGAICYLTFISSAQSIVTPKQRRGSSHPTAASTVSRFAAATIFAFTPSTTRVICNKLRATIRSPRCKTNDEFQITNDEFR